MPTHENLTEHLQELRGQLTDLTLKNSDELIDFEKAKLADVINEPAPLSSLMLSDKHHGRTLTAARSMGKSIALPRLISELAEKSCADHDGDTADKVYKVTKTAKKPKVKISPLMQGLLFKAGITA